MFYEDETPPCFHVLYGDFKTTIDLNDEVVTCFMPKRALEMIFEWMDMHKDQLLENWTKCQAGKIPDKIEPLE